MQHLFVLGHLSDHEEDKFTLKMLSTEYAFAEVSMDARSGNVSLKVDLEEASQHHNGNYTINFQVEEFLGATEIV